MQDITTNINVITGDDKDNYIDARTNAALLLANIEGFGGNDIIHAGSGKNTVEGGAGDDIFQYYHYQSGKQTLFLAIDNPLNADGHPKEVAFERDAPDGRNLNHQIELPDGTQSPYSSLLYSGHMTITDFGDGNDLLYFSNISLFNELPEGTDRADDEALPASLFYQKYRLNEDGNELEVTDDSGHEFVKIFGQFDFAKHHAPDIFQTNNTSQDTFLLAILENYTGELALDDHMVTAPPVAEL